MLDMAGIREGTRVLDIAAGAGGQTLRAASRVNGRGAVLATDISSNILAFVAEEARSAGLANVTTRVMDGENLDIEDGVFDAVISRLGVIYFPDRARGLSEGRRVLRDGGRIAVMGYTTPDRNQFFSIPVSIIREVAALPPPAPGLPGPFSLGAPGVLEAALKQAGFKDVRVEAVYAPLRLASTAECLAFERESFGALHTMLANVSAAERDKAWRRIEDELRQFEGPAGFVGPCELLVGTGQR